MKSKRNEFYGESPLTLCFPMFFFKKLKYLKELTIFSLVKANKLLQVKNIEKMLILILFCLTVLSIFFSPI